MDRIQCLVFSFYREESIEKELEPLIECRMFWRGASIFVECLNQKHFEEILALKNRIIVPLAQLSIGNILVISSPESIKRVVPIKLSFHSDMIA